jgi:hypothetical protein
MNEKKEQKNKPGFIAALVKKVLKLKPDLSFADVYRSMEMNKQNAHDQIRVTNEVQPAGWARWRKGLGISRTLFWKEAADFYDPKESSESLEE